MRLWVFSRLVRLRSFEQEVVGVWSSGGCSIFESGEGSHIAEASAERCTELQRPPPFVEGSASAVKAKALLVLQY